MTMQPGNGQHDPVYRLECYLWRAVLFTTLLIFLFYVGMRWPG